MLCQPSVPRPQQQQFTQGTRPQCLLLGPSAARTVSASAASAAVNTSASMHSNVAARKFMLSLERSVGGGAGKDEALRATNAFSAEVFPDLPIATTWNNLWKVMRSRGVTTSVASSTATDLPVVADVAPDKLKVITVAANLRSLKEIEARMTAATSSRSPEQLASGGRTAVPPAVAGRAADALLLVSGSHPVRTLPGTRQLLPTSVTTLQLARQLRERGSLPASTQLWAVSNPNIEADAALAERKVDQGAQVLLTQPPFDMESFSAWVDDAHRRGVLERARLLVGHPMISSAGNMAFWLSLSSCIGRPRCRSLLLTFSTQEAQEKEGMDGFCQRYNQQVTTEVSSWAGVAGFHMMPITPKAKKACIAAVQPGGMLHSPLAS